MRYMGSKGRHGREILKTIGSNFEPWVEPFVGGGNMLAHVESPLRMASDFDKYSVAVLEALSTGWLPPESLSEEAYDDIRSNPDNFPSELVGFAGFGCSFGGKFFGGYARGGGRDHQNEAYRSCVKQGLKLRGATFRCCSYLDVNYPNGSTVYMDPPYFSTTGYSSGSFDHGEFWTFVRGLSKSCNVYVSEYQAPDDFRQVWSKSVSSSVDKDTGSKQAVEKLFKL